MRKNIIVLIYSHTLVRAMYLRGERREFGKLIDRFQHIPVSESVLADPKVGRTKAGQDS